MKKNYFILIACFAAFFFSCEKKDHSESENEQYINRWTYDQMSFYYLWNTQIPSQPNYELYPGLFFESLLYKPGKVEGDRFSWIQENYVDLLGMLQGVTPYDIGFEFTLEYQNDYSYDLLGVIEYVKPATDAERQGLKRGEIFTGINGVALTVNNYRELMSSNATSLTFSFAGEKGTVEKTIQKMPDYAENPVFFDNIYEVDGHKIGYLVYNFFASGPVSGNNSYDRKLNEVFGRFKGAGITELVLDLRYNSGGSMNSAILLGSMIVPGLDVSQVFTKSEFNELFQKELVAELGPEILVDKFRDRLAENDEMINNVGETIQKLYVLTSSRTASASELVINGLKPYMSDKIILIGTNTVGKNVGSVSIYEENNPKNKWGMQPIVLRYFNRDGNADFLNGFPPDIVEEDNAEKLPLGDTDEVMLNTAINHITGGNVLRSASVNYRLPFGSSIEQKAWTNRTFVDPSLLEKLNRKRK
jgi:C-terminal processing protease CtpA/Prc